MRLMKGNEELTFWAGHVIHVNSGIPFVGFVGFVGFFSRMARMWNVWCCSELYVSEL